MQLPYQCRHCQCSVTTGTDVGRCSLETTGNIVFDMMSHTWDDSGAAFEQNELHGFYDNILLSLK